MAYNLSAFAGAGAQFFDSNGVPLVGGLLYVYTAGTTTPATTWTTNSGAVANTNPIVLNAAGRTPYEIWLNSGVTYKFALYTASGVLIGTYDNIPAIDDPTSFNNLITVTGTNTLIGTSVPPYTAYVAGMTLSFIPVAANTGAVTIDVDGLGAKQITFGGSIPLSANQLTANSIVTLEYDGTRFQLTSSSAGFDANVTSINGGQIAGFRNHIINGSMSISQRGTSFTGSNIYTLDRWFNVNFSSGAYTVSKSSDAPANQGLASSLRATVTTATSVSSSDFAVISQKIEGYNIIDLINKSFVVSFWARSSKTGVHSVSFKANAAFYVTTYQINAANTWEYKTVSVSGGIRASDSPNTTNGTGLECFFALEAGSSFTTSTLNTWSNTSAFASSGQVNCLDTVGNIFAVTGVQLEIGSVATPFEQRLYGTELALCQRYYYRMTADSGGTFGMGFNNSTTVAIISVSLPVTMRVAPTSFDQTGTAANYRIGIAGSTISCSSVPAVDTGTPTNARFLATVASGLTAGQGCYFASTVAGGYLGWSAEL
jgi:hypothetical protein